MCLKNAVIGSNKQKGSVISQGIVPKLTTFLKSDDVPLTIRLDAAIVIGKRIAIQTHTIMPTNFCHFSSAIAQVHWQRDPNHMSDHSSNLKSFKLC